MFCCKVTEILIRVLEILTLQLKQKPTDIKLQTCRSSGCAHQKLLIIKQAGKQVVCLQLFVLFSRVMTLLTCIAGYCMR